MFLLEKLISLDFLGPAVTALFIHSSVRLQEMIYSVAKRGNLDIDGPKKTKFN